MSCTIHFICLDLSTKLNLVIMSKIKVYIGLILIALFIGLCTTIGIQRNNINKAKIKLEQSEINYLALENECNKLTTDNIEYKLTVTQLSLSQDSLISALNRARINLGIKDKEIKRLGYIASQAQKTDTLYIRDSIFLNNVKIDTTIQDGKWYKCDIHLESPNIVSISPEFISEKSVITSTEKVILNPKKCKFLRLFQKKSTIIKTEVVENNPYIKNTQERFMEVIK